MLGITKKQFEKRQQANKDLVGIIIENAFLSRMKTENLETFQDGSKTWTFFKSEDGEIHIRYSNYAHLPSIGVYPYKKRLFNKYYRSGECYIYKQPFFTNDPYAIYVDELIFTNFEIVNNNI